MEESIPPQRPGHVRAIAWTIVLMLCSFVLGVFVGLHPNWIPIAVPLPTGGTAVTPENPGAETVGMPTTMPSTQEATTQP
jgi:hypothetical protein